MGRGISLLLLCIFIVIETPPRQSSHSTPYSTSLSIPPPVLSSAYLLRLLLAILQSPSQMLSFLLYPSLLPATPSLASLTCIKHSTPVLFPPPFPNTTSPYSFFCFLHLYYSFSDSPSCLLLRLNFYFIFAYSLLLFPQPPTPPPPPYSFSCFPHLYYSFHS